MGLISIDVNICHKVCTQQRKTVNVDLVNIDVDICYSVYPQLQKSVKLDELLKLTRIFGIRCAHSENQLQK